MNIVMERGFDLKPLRNFPDFHQIELLGYYMEIPSLGGWTVRLKVFLACTE
jgi:hypothetical protein